MLIRLLGQVEVADGDGWLRAGPPKQACVLTALALSPGTAISIDVLAHRVWGRDAPHAVRNIIYGHVARLRRLLRPHETAELRRVGLAEYRLDIATDQVDALYARTLADRARAARSENNTAAARDYWRRAAELWTGPALTGIDGAWAERTRRRLRDEHIAALTGLSGCELELGRPGTVVADLESMVEQYPLAEHLVANLMLGLYRCGRATDALDRYIETRCRLRDELGNEPGERLRQLHQQILRQDPQLRPGADSGGTGPARTPPAPAQLPPDVATFAGRGLALQQLDDLLPDASEAMPTTVVVSAIAGMAGIGKTTTAVHWAHRIADRFPDGQLYVNLRGFDASGRPADPGEALRGFLTALGVSSRSIPVGVDAQAGMYRTMLAGKRILVVLDNAHDEEQVRPLLPGTAGCLALVTSRNRLGGLVTSHGARPVALDLLTADEARQLLEKRIGRARPAAEPEAVASIIDHCAKLPLALAIVAARATAMPGVRLRLLADELCRARSSLDVLTTTDNVTDVRAVFSWSYQQLTAPAARMFRLLGLHPGPDISTAAAASLADAEPAMTRSMLDELTRVHLIAEHVPGRFTLHDLLRAYAAELADECDSGDDRRSAIHRALDHYQHTAHSAALLLNKHRTLAQPPPCLPGVTIDRLDDSGQAMNWFKTEHRVLLAAYEQATRIESDRRILHFATALTTFLSRIGSTQEKVDILRSGLSDSSTTHDPNERAIALRDLGSAYRQLGMFDEAHAHLEDALNLCRDLGDVVGQSRTHIDWSWALSDEGRYREALDHDHRAFELSSRIDDKVGQAAASNAIAWDLNHLGDRNRALGHGWQALAFAQQVGHTELEGAIWDTLGAVQSRLDNHVHAISSYQRAVDIRRSLGDLDALATSLDGLGDAHLAAGDKKAAIDTWQDAVVLLDELHHPDAETTHDKISSLLDRVET